MSYNESRAMLRRLEDGSTVQELGSTAGSAVDEQGPRSNGGDDQCASTVTKVTLRADESGTKATVLTPDCKHNTVVQVTTQDSHSFFDGSNYNIEVVESLPSAYYVKLSGNRIQQIAASTNADDIIVLDLSSNALTSLAGLRIPRGVTKLVLEGNSITKVTPDMFPAHVVDVTLKTNGILSLADLAFADTIERIDLSTNTIKTFENFAMPAQTTTFLCANCGIRTVGGIRVPPTLRHFNLIQNEVDTFDIATASVHIYKALDAFAVTSRVRKCEQGTLVNIRGVAKGCRLDDEIYNAKYTVAATTDQPSVLENGASPTSSNGGGGKWLTSAILSGGAVALVVATIVGVLLVRRRRHQQSNAYKDKLELAELGDPSSTTTGPTQYIHGATSTRITGTSTFLASQSHVTAGRPISTSTTSHAVESFPHDVRTDDSLVAFRLLPSDVVRGKLLARGGYGAVYLASFRGETVVMKQMLPDKTRHKQVIKSFMDEIRICAQLDHPKIVTFLGITWTTLQDLSVVLEYIPNGDLAALLTAHHQKEVTFPGPRGARSGFGWFHSNTRLKCKSLLALDIAEALVYLHSFESPIIHRDLKPKNILLSHTWEAKLTDFGISRAKDEEDMTMTAEIGTVAWIAPEVLKGERYSEKADVYSLGVILAELDTCRRPYSSNAQEEEEGGGCFSNTRIAVLVSAGQLKPSLHRDCPKSVRALIKRCLAFRPEDRPSAIQIHYELRNLELDDDERQQREDAMRNASNAASSLSSLSRGTEKKKKSRVKRGGGGTY